MPARDFGARPSPRCSCCGALAEFATPNTAPARDGSPPNVVQPPFACERHRQPEQTEIAGYVEIRRVQLVLSVFVAGVSLEQGAAEAEAAQFVEVALRQLGGCPELFGVRSETGWYSPMRRRERLRMKGVGE
jgi:hypothetical protein